MKVSIIIPALNEEAMLPKLLNSVKAQLLGHRLSGAGVMTVNTYDTAKSGALAFRFLLSSKDSGGTRKYAYFVFYRGSFKTTSGEAETLGSGTPKIQTETLEGTFFPRLDNGNIMSVADGGDGTVLSGAIKSWFTKVYEPDDEIDEETLDETEMRGEEPGEDTTSEA